MTGERRLHDQDQAIQILLAKVFLAAEMPAYIVDQHGRFLMTNPAFDRLIGASPGSLAGTLAAERYAPACHAAIAGLRAKQEAEGGDQRFEASLLGPGGNEIACTLTCAMVRRADLPRLQVVMIRTDAPKPGAPWITAGGRIHLIGLEEVRYSLGPRWDSVRDRAMETAEHVIKRHLGPADASFRTHDEGFVVCFAGASEDEASFRSASIARDVRRRLIGEGSTLEMAHVFSAATTLPPEARGLPATELAKFVRDRVAQRLHESQEAARSRLFEALRTAGYATDWVRTRGRDEAVGVLLRLPAATERAIDAAIAVLPSAETVNLDMDSMLLGFAQEHAAHAATSNVNQLIFLALSSEILLVRKRMESCVEACRAIPERLRQRLVIIVTAPPQTAARQLSNGLQRLRPFCRSLGVGLDTLDPVELDSNVQGVAILLVDASACRTPGWQAKAKARLNSVHPQRCRLMVRGAEPDMVTSLFAGGADLVAVAGTETVA